MQLAHTTIERIKSLLQAGRHLSVAYSGGKDSTCLLVLFLEAVRQLIAEGRPVPQCYITTAKTRRDMPATTNYLAGALNNLQVFIGTNKLPVEVVEVEPSLSGRFTWTTIGRGKLPRYEGQTRDCARDEKIVPQQRAMKAVAKRCGTPVIALVGTRTEESRTRAASMKKHSMDEITIVDIDGHQTYSPMANWELDDVWEVLAYTQQDEQGNAKLFPTFTKTHEELFQLYRDANEGTCGVLLGDKGNKAGCGSRFGCAWCTVVGEKDRSLESLISESEERYGYMKGLVKFRKFLRAIRFDMKRRDFRGRRISAVGHMKVTPDYFNAQTKRELLRFLLTLDAREAERAQEHERKWYAGEIEHTEVNSELCHPMFQFVTMDDILAIDVAWSLARDWPEASAAARDWLEVHELGYRYDIPEIATAPRVSIPKTRWFDVTPVVDGVVGVKGLVETSTRIEALSLTESAQIQLSAGAGFSYIDNVRGLYHELSLVDVSEVCRAAVHHGWLQMPKRMLDEYDTIAKRNDYLLRLMQQERPTTICEWSGNERLMSVHEYLLENSITDQEHKELVAQVEREKLENDEQSDLFGADSIIVAMEETPVKAKSTKAQRAITESVQLYVEATRQEELFI